MREGRLAEAQRNKLLASMTDEVSELVLEDNRLQSIACRSRNARTAGIPGFVRTIEMLEASGGSIARSRGWKAATFCSAAAMTGVA